MDLTDGVLFSEFSHTVLLIYIHVQDTLLVQKYHIS